MIIDIVTLFPNMFDNFLNESIIKRAIDQKLVTVNVHNLRDYTTYPNRQVDDYGYGGGHGMVIMVEPVYNAIEALKKANTKVIAMTADGQPYKQKTAQTLSNFEHLIIVCGHYEGFDERVLEYVDFEICIGDYILTGGEIPAMLVVDSVTRLIPGVIKEISHIEESFTNGLLDYPVYTKPRLFNENEVPTVLLSGNHQEIEKYRRSAQINRTKIKRPDLWSEYEKVQD